MLTEERLDRIRGLLASQGRVLATELAATFGVSEDTARRDLRELARLGDCRRVYGGALLPAPDLGTIEQRLSAMNESKIALAGRVADLIEDGQTIFIDAGSTNLAVARALPRAHSLTVVTNAPAVALALSDHPRCTIIVLGGQFDTAKGACLGAQTAREAQRMYADVLVLGSCGVDSEIGITTLDAEEAELKRCLVGQSGRLIIAATADKIGTIAPFKVAGCDAVDTLVVETRLDAAMVARFEASGIQLLTAEP